MAGLAGLILAALVALLAGPSLRLSLFDLWQRMAPRDLSASPVRVVMIDSESLKAVGPWPWPRYHVARLVEEIAARKPAAIGLDMIFPEPDRIRPDIFAAFYPELSGPARDQVLALPSMDGLFGQVIAGAPVVLGRAATESPGGDPAGLIVDPVIDGSLPSALSGQPRAVVNIDPLEQAALGHGLLNGPPDPDGRVRAVPLLMRVGARPMPGFAMELARVALGKDALSVSPTRVALGERRIPVDDRGALAIRFGHLPPAHIVSAADVLRQGFAADAFAGRIVLIGLSAEGTADIVATPMAAEGFGTLVQAQAVDAIVRHGWLERPLWAGPVEWAAGIALALLCIAFLPIRWRWSPLPVLLLLSFACWLAFDRFALLLDPVRPLMLAGGASLGVAAGLFAETRRERERLRETLLQERLAAAATEGELQAARSIQIGMLPPRAQLAQTDPRLDVDAVLEPARSIGGDLYDVVRLDADRIAFLLGDVTGKGVPAALFMALSKALAKSVAMRGLPDLGEVAWVLNEELMRDNGEAMNVTMIIGIIDLTTGRVLLVNAGHEDPLRVDAAGKVTVHKLDGGPPFCIVDFPYPEEHLTLEPGETLVLISDGVSEAQDADEQLFGHDRLTQALSGLPSATGMVDGLRDAVRSFENGTESSDDLTILALRYRGPDSGKTMPAV